MAIHQWRDVLAGSGQDFNALLKENLIDLKETKRFASGIVILELEPAQE